MRRPVDGQAAGGEPEAQPASVGGRRVAPGQRLAVNEFFKPPAVGGPCRVGSAQTGFCAGFDPLYNDHGDTGAMAKGMQEPGDFRANSIWLIGGSAGYGSSDSGLPPGQRAGASTVSPAGAGPWQGNPVGMAEESK
jgi:hypothetical protein